MRGQNVVIIYKVILCNEIHNALKLLMILKRELNRFINKIDLFSII